MESNYLYLSGVPFIDVDFGFNLKTKERFLVIRGSKKIKDWMILLNKYCKDFKIDFILIWDEIPKYLWENKIDEVLIL